ncbi:hypothetical protein HK405_008324, partial [Cladochytrium tenue]
MVRRLAPPVIADATSETAETSEPLAAPAVPDDLGHNAAGVPVNPLPSAAKPLLQQPQPPPIASAAELPGAAAAPTISPSPQPPLLRQDMPVDVATAAVAALFARFAASTASPSHHAARWGAPVLRRLADQLRPLLCDGTEGSN